jgi:hypothetical protein
MMRTINLVLYIDLVKMVYMICNLLFKKKCVLLFLLFFDNMEQ